MPPTESDGGLNLPNDERVIQQKGSKRVMLKNVQEGEVPLDSGADRLARPFTGRAEGRILSTLSSPTSSRMN